jgi:hypothetical protein
LLMIEVKQGDVDLVGLTACQDLGDEGAFAAAMHGYLEWIASRYEQVQERLRRRVVEVRNAARARSAPIHGRLATTLAELQSGFGFWLKFACEVGAINAVERNALERRNMRALAEVANFQASYHCESDPALRFLSLLRTALVSGRAHVAYRKGRQPQHPALCGWQRSAKGGWRSAGARIGSVHDSDVFLDPAVSYEVAQQMAGAERLCCLPRFRVVPFRTAATEFAIERPTTGASIWGCGWRRETRQLSSTEITAFRPQMGSKWRARSH